MVSNSKFTEENTFRTLKRLPFEQMYEIIDSCWHYTMGIRHNLDDVRNKLLEENGWTFFDYKLEVNKMYIKQLSSEDDK